MNHFLERCSCGIILNQCRCPGNKRETVSSLPCTHKPMTPETVRRYVPRILQDDGMIESSEVAHYTHLNLKQYVTYDDHKSAMDALHAQAVALAHCLREAVDSFKVTQRPSSYPPEHWCNHAQALLEGK